MSKTMIIIGAGLAGLSAALTAAEAGGQVILLSSMPSERAQSVMAEGGINAALNTKGEQDTPEEHEQDTLKAGCYLADPNAVHGLTQAAPRLVRRLAALGAQLNRNADGTIDLRNFGGQKKKRTAFAQSDTGKQLVTALIDAVRRYEAKQQIVRLHHHSFQTLLLDGEACCGCVAVNDFTGERMQIAADAVIMAVGGMHGLFGDTTGSAANNAQAAAELFRLGVPFANLEMVQYHPTTARRGGKRLLISEAARGEGGRLYVLRDGKPHYFMEEKYPELGNLMPRDITAREIRRQESQVYLQMTHLSKELFAKKLSGLREDCMTYLGIDPQKEPIPVEPGIHYFMGGICVDEQHRTSIRNLYAAGECAAQYHGANRLGGNSLLGAVYGGETAAKTAMSEANGSSLKPTEPQAGAQTVQLTAVQDSLQRAMGVVRDEAALQEALTAIRPISGSLSLLAQAMLRSSLARKESRGAQFRADYPQTDPAFCRTCIAQYDGAQITIRFAEIPEVRSV